MLEFNFTRQMPGKKLKHNFAQTLHIESPHLAPPKLDKQFLFSPPSFLPVVWVQADDATPVIILFYM